MKRTFKSNQRKKQLSRQHHKITSRRQSHFNQTLNEQIEQHNNWQASQ